MRYDGDATDVDTPLEDAFAQRRGVCQDFTHIMIACLRESGRAGRLCQRLLAHRAAQGQAAPRRAPTPCMPGCRPGAGLEAGWVEFDPTNKMMAGADHIVAARGRDYSDVAPVRGMLRTAGDQEISQAVDVLPLG